MLWAFIAAAIFASWSWMLEAAGGHDAARVVLGDFEVGRF